MTKLETYQECKQLIARRMKGDGGEAPAGALKERRVDERVIQCVWYDRMFAEEALKTAPGRTLEIVDPGRWNHESGPDFLGASLLINGKPRKGDVEIHLDACDWKHHGHDRDFEYNRVILHAVLDSPDGKISDVKHNGEEAERFVMRPFIHPDLESIRRGLNIEDYPFEESDGRGKCAAIIAEMSDEFMECYLDLAARERMEAKIRRFADQALGEPLYQVFYQALMTSMGHKGGKALFFLLAKRTPLDELAGFLAATPASDRARLMEAILLHVANLLPQEATESKLDDETREYVGRLRGLWAPVEPYFSDRIIPKTQRWRSGIRPVNFPERRIAGVSLLIAGASEPQKFFNDLIAAFRQIIPSELTRQSARQCAKRLAALLCVEAHPYWTRRYSFIAQPAKMDMDLIGESRAQSLILNALLPLAILKARGDGDAELERLAISLYRKYPPLQENSITKFMRGRLFSDAARAKNLLTTEARHQALFYLFQDCCNNAGMTCDQCSYLRAE
ncbi:MAG: DUF2851 family protein [Candidatus Sumerlaeota bacterium]|nr:DUF2851 family protein [Candidatus Sumerlaeota bacterium]